MYGKLAKFEHYINNSKTPWRNYFSTAYKCRGL